QVLISADGMNRELFYVAATRARSDITVFTTHYERMRESIRISGARASAMDLAKDAGVMPHHKCRGRSRAPRGRFGRWARQSSHAFRTWWQEASEVKPKVNVKETVEALQSRGAYVSER